MATSREYLTESERGQEPPLAAAEKPLLLSVPDAAHLLGIGTTFCWSLVRGGMVPSIRLGRRVLVPRALLESLVSEGELDGSA